MRDASTLRLGRTVAVGTNDPRSTSAGRIATTEQPAPTLDGARLSRVLTVLSAKVVIRDLAITNGKARQGGGIFVSWRVILPSALG